MSHPPQIEFYLQQSCFSNPQQHTSLFDDLPDDIGELCKIVRGVYVHYRDKRIPSSETHRLTEVDTRYLSQILDNIIGLDNHSLMKSRDTKQCFIGCCRDASLLLCSILRHKGIPARIRVGFATYIQTESPFPYVDHVVTEYWDATLQRWKKVDPEQDERLIEKNQIDFEVLDIPSNRFLVSGQAWQIGRESKARWNDFGVNDDVKGRWFVASYLIRDLAALNRHEVLLWDTWGLMNVFDKLSPSDLELLDRIAHLTTSKDVDIDKVREVYTLNSNLVLPEVVMNYSPVSKWREEKLNCH